MTKAYNQLILKNHIYIYIECKLINFDDKTRKNDSRMIKFDNKIKVLNPNWWEIPNHPLIRGSEAGKRNALLSLIHHQEKDDNDITDKIFLHANDP